MAKENLNNLHIYGVKTSFMERYIQFLAVAPKIDGEYLLMTTQQAEAVAFAKVYRSEHPGISQFIDDSRRLSHKERYFHLLYKEKDKLILKSIVKH